MTNDGWNTQLTAQKKKMEKTSKLINAMLKGNVVSFDNINKPKTVIGEKLNFSKNGQFVKSTEKQLSSTVTKKELRKIELQKREDKICDIAYREYGQSFHPRTHDKFIGNTKTVSKGDNRKGIITQSKEKQYQYNAMSPYRWNLKGVKTFVIGIKFELDGKTLKTLETIKKRIPKTRTSSKLYPIGKSHHTNPKNYCILDTIRRKERNNRKARFEKHRKEKNQK